VLQIYGAMSKALIFFPAWFNMLMWLYPLDMKLLKGKWSFVVLKQKERLKSAKNEHFRKLVKLTVGNKVLFQHILANSWFGSKANMNFIHHDLYKYFVFAMKSNRCVALSRKEASCGQFQRVDSLEWNVRREIRNALSYL